MLKIIKLIPQPDFHLNLRFSDGTEGTVDLAHLAGNGVFSVWKDKKKFESVFIDENGAAAWPGGLDLCADALYLKVTRKKAEDIFPNLKEENFHA